MKNKHHKFVINMQFEWPMTSQKNRVRCINSIHNFFFSGASDIFGAATEKCTCKWLHYRLHWQWNIGHFFGLFNQRWHNARHFFFPLLLINQHIYSRERPLNSGEIIPWYSLMWFPYFPHRYSYFLLIFTLEIKWKIDRNTIFWKINEKRIHVQKSFDFNWKCINCKLGSVFLCSLVYCEVHTRRMESLWCLEMYTQRQQQKCG